MLQIFLRLSLKNGKESSCGGGWSSIQQFCRANPPLFGLVHENADSWNINKTEIKIYSLQVGFL